MHEGLFNIFTLERHFNCTKWEVAKFWPSWCDVSGNHPNASWPKFSNICKRSSCKIEGKLAQTQEFQSGSIFSHAPNFETFQERESCCSWKFEPLSSFQSKAAFYDNPCQAHFLTNCKSWMRFYFLALFYIKEGKMSIPIDFDLPCSALIAGLWLFCKSTCSQNIKETSVPFGYILISTF